MPPLMRFKIVFLVVVTTAAIKGQSQIINIDKVDTSAYQIKPVFNASLTVGVEIDKQKTTLYDATNTAELMLQKRKELYFFSGSYRFTYNGPQDFLNTGYLHLRWRHHYKNRFHPETFTQYQWDNVRGLEHRALLGANLRFNFWKQGKIDFNAGLGLMYEDEKWNYAGVDSAKIPADPTPIVNHFIKLNSYLRLDWKSGANSDLALALFFQTRPDRIEPRIAPMLQWSVSAGKHLSINTGFSSVYDAKPVVPIHHFYFTFSNSISLKW